MRILGQRWRSGALIAAGLILSNGAVLGADKTPVVRVNALVREGAVRVEAQASAPFEYATYRPSKSLYVVDMTGVSSGDDAGARVVASELVKSYRVLSYTAGEKPVVRLEILMSDGVEPRIERKDSQDLSLVVARDSGTSAAENTTISAAPALVPAAAMSPRENGTAATQVETIRRVNLSQNGDETEVSVSGTGHLNYRAIRLQNPDRVVLDFAGAHLSASAGHHLASNLNPVREIRMAQFTADVSRVVIDLREPADYRVDTAENSVTVSFASAAATGGVKIRPEAPASSVSTTEAENTKKGTQEIATTREAQIPAPIAVLPTGLTQTSSALASPAAEKAQSQMAAPTIQAASNASAAASQTENPAPNADSQTTQPPAATATPSEPAAMQAATPAPSNKYSGEPISVNLKDVDLRDFFRLIHEISGLNVVVDPAVKGNLTIVLEDVPWDQALDIVLHNNDLDKQLDGNVLRIATKTTLRKEAEEGRDLARAQIQAANLVTTTRKLSYVKAVDMATLLKKFLSERGDIMTDSYSNSVIIRDVQSTMPVIDNLIRQLDRKSQQVEIEARVVEADRNFAREIGTQLAFSGKSGNSALGGSNATGLSSFLPVPPIVNGGATNLGTNVVKPTSGIQYLFSSTNFALDFAIDAAESRGVVKLLSEPKVITQNNQKASVKQGLKIPVQSDVNNTISIVYVDAVLELDVTPQITAEGTIFMDVSVENDQADFTLQVQGTPAISTQAAVTKVTVDDGATVVIGGVIATNQSTSVDQVPILGSVPLLGNLFKHTAVQSKSTELLFFLTPRILPS